MSELWGKIRAGAKIETTKGEDAIYIADSPLGWPIVGFLFDGVEDGLDWRFTQVNESGKALDYRRTIVLVCADDFLSNDRGCA